MDTLNEINNYIGNGYNRFHDYAVYQSSQAGIPDEADDILGFVLLDILEKEESFLQQLYESKNKNDQFRELDNYILRMIKLNATSDTSPYRHKILKTGKFKKDENADYTRLDIADEPYREIDEPAEQLANFRLIREIADRMDLSKWEYEIFRYRFLEGESISDLGFDEKEKKKLYDLSFQIKSAISYCLKFQKKIPELTAKKTKSRSRQMIDHYLLAKEI